MDKARRKLDFCGRNESAFCNLQEGGRGELLVCGFEEFVAREEYRQQIIDHEGFVLLHVLCGEGEFYAGRSAPVPFGPGCVIQRYPGSDHGFTLARGVRFQGCFLKVPATLRRLLELSGLIGQHEAALLEPGLRKEIPTGIERILHAMARPESVSSGEVLLLAHQLARDILLWHRERLTPSPEENLLRRACVLLAESSELSLPRISQTLGCGYSRFRKLFKERLGMSPGEYRIRRRIAAAQEMLRERSRAPKEIAHALGYPDVQLFARQFKRVSGVTPGSFRRLLHLR